MAFIGFCVLMVVGSLLMIFGGILFLACLSLGSGRGESLFGALVVGAGIGLWYLAMRYAPFSVVMS